MLWQQKFSYKKYYYIEMGRDNNDNKNHHYCYYSYKSINTSAIKCIK